MHNQIMQQEAKLVIAEELGSQKHEYLIFNNQKVGQGGFGIVKKAIRNDRPQEILVSKILPYDGDPSKKEKIQKQLDIIRKLVHHENLVIVQPIKCYSEKNYYIFMEYCQQGTLQDLMKKKKYHFSEEEVFDIFYQLMNGYKVLWQAKILHQDLKPENILIKNGKFKLTDFGFSILHEGHKYGNIREGTLAFMPLEKLTQKEYYANTKSDVYSFGVIFFRLITGHHPYVLSRGKEHRQYLKELKMNPLQLRPHFSSRFSLKFQHLFDLVLSMICKDEKSRIDFEEIYAYIEAQEIFESIKQKNKNIPQQKVVQNQFKKFTIIDQSAAIAIPFMVPEHEEGKYREQAENKAKNKEELKLNKNLQLMENFIVSQRIIVYFFDRLNRRIYVQKLKQLYKTKEEAAMTEKISLTLLLLCKKIIQGLLKECKTGVLFSIQDWKMYRKQNFNLLPMIERDENYIEDLIIDTLSQASQTKIVERKNLLNLSKGNFQEYKKFINEHLVELLKAKIMLIDPENKNFLVTLCYIISAVDILQNFEKWEKQALDLEKYFREIETEECELLFSRVIQQLEQKEIPFTLDLGEVEQ